MKSKEIFNSIPELKKILKEIKSEYYAPHNRRSNGKQTSDAFQTYYGAMSGAKLRLCELQNHPQLYRTRNGTMCECKPVAESTKKILYEELQNYLT